MGGRQGWNVKRSGRFDQQRFEVAHRVRQVGMVLGIAQRIQRHDEVHHRRIDGAQALGEAGAFQNPMLRLADGGIANALRPALFPDFEDAVEMVEQHRKAVAFGQFQAHAGQQQFIQRKAGRRAPVRPARLHDGKRHQNGARPRRHFVEHVAGQQHDLRRHRGRVLARVQAEKAEVDLDVAVGRPAARPVPECERRARRSGVALRRVARQLEGAIGFDGGVELGRSAAVDVEAAVRQLAVQDGLAGFCDAHAGRRIPDGAIRLVHPKLQQDVVRFERGVGRQLAAPEALGRLPREQSLARPRDGFRARRCAVHLLPDFAARPHRRGSRPLIRHENYMVARHRRTS